MIKFNKEHKYLICIDSDGTIMDTMTIKHYKCFGPCFIDVFNFIDQKEDILNEWNRINLFSLTRGINRFEGLKTILEYIKNKYNDEIEGFEIFSLWVETTKKLGNDSLKEEINKYPDNICLNKALKWSEEVNKNIALLPLGKPFEYVKETLLTLSNFADLVGVSSANPAAVKKEWQENDLMKYFKYVACQDEGSKTFIIKEAIKQGYKKSDVIMLGDALGDLKSAHENEVYFYPITPKHECEYWKKLNNEVSLLIKNDKYKKEVETIYINEFLTILEKGE